MKSSAAVATAAWGSICVFKNEHGKLREVTAALGLSKWTGLWTSVTTGDFDNDGRPDIVVGNWGLNSYYNMTPAGPWRLYYGDFNSDGQVTMLEAFRDERSGGFVPWRDMDAVAPGLPWMRARRPGVGHAGAPQRAVDTLAWGQNHDDPGAKGRARNHGRSIRPNRPSKVNNAGAWPSWPSRRRPQTSSGVAERMLHKFGVRDSKRYQRRHFGGSRAIRAILPSGTDQ